MRILKISPTARAGTPQYAHNLANALVDLGHEVAMVTAVGYEMTPYPRKYEVLEVFDRYKPHPSKLAKFYSLVRSFQPDIIHFQGAQHPTLYLIMCKTLRLITKARFVYTPQDVLPTYQKANQMKAFVSLYREMGHVFLNAKQNLDTVKDYFGVKEESVTILPIADLTAFTRTDLTPVDPECPPNAKVILFFGQIQLRKGLDSLVLAFERVAKAVPDAFLFVVGQPQIDVAPYQESLERAGLQDRAKIIPRYATFEEMAGHFHRADVVVLPYETGWNSGVLASAMGFGKPVVATRVGGFDEVVQDGVNGLLVEPKDPASLAKALIQVITDNELRAAFDEGVPAVAARYSWNEIAKQTQDAYQSVTGSPALSLVHEHA